MNILEEIAAKTTERIRKEKEAIPLSTLRSAAEKRRAGAPEFLFEKALKKPGVSFICEVKRPLLPKESSLKISPIWTLRKAMKPPAPMPSPASRSPSIFSEGTLTWRRSQPAFPSRSYGRISRWMNI